MLLFRFALSFLLAISCLSVQAQIRRPHFLEKVYAQNCNTPPHEIIYFVQTEKYGVVSLYPEKTSSTNTLSIKGSAWGNVSGQNGEITSFTKNGKSDNRAVWTRGNQLALVLGNGQFREKQKFYELCPTNSTASKFALKDSVLEQALLRFTQFEDKMAEQKKNSDCYIFNAAQQSCATAGSYERCMSIRWGEDWLNKEARCK